ncbi:prolyl oligopeptidase family serine peptidase [Arenicella xantha]|uniref:Prolyl oligopeptidase n=1 Tax=Arenicella xantha TaxID=644221 RepID=A0A395JIK6_9GAMM|nr:prolyl oligopeptidase family serine peptidase [Arenicella xantha]RBP48777.1 prolyl oligopeptidase [Arenicella xantha]
MNNVTHQTRATSQNSAAAETPARAQNLSINIIGTFLAGVSLWLISDNAFSGVVNSTDIENLTNESVVSEVNQDPYQWLEQIEGDKSLAWVTAANAKTEARLGNDPLYADLYSEALDALTRKDKLPELTQRGDWLYSLKKDQEHPRGRYLRTKVSTFNAGKPDWQTVLDIDALSADDGVKWVFQSMNCLAPAYTRCLVSLSPGGTDASELREFDLTNMAFVADGFKLPSAKMQVAWRDLNHVFVATDFGSDSMTESGYPRSIKVWERGTPLVEAKRLFETDVSSVSASVSHFGQGADATTLLDENLSYWTSRYYIVEGDKTHELALPDSSVVEGMIQGQLVVSLKDDWAWQGKTYAQGAVLLVAPKAVLMANDSKVMPTVLIEPRSDTIVEAINVLDEVLLVTVLEDVNSKIIRFEKNQQGWQSSWVDLPNSGTISVQTTNDKTGAFYVRYEGFITAPTLFYVDSELKANQVLQQKPSFDGALFKVEQHFTKSADGTRVPYFVVMHKDTKLDGSNPTLMFSYGGFRVSLTPSYSGSYEALNGVYGNAWLARGGVFVLANIRGGGEYGPAWHAAALRENKVKSFEDFEAVAEDLIARKITSPKHLGIEGRSNGGLLVGATMIRRPDLYGAVICGVPLLDMQRYHTLLAGASWMAEYGDPDTDDWTFMQTYSPYQNLDKDTTYPPIFFFTSTLDDRVHPGHARKMAARMAAFKQQVDYYENTEGGHKGSVTSEQLAKRVALGFTHLWRHLK